MKTIIYLFVTYCSISVLYAQSLKTYEITHKDLRYGTNNACLDKTGRNLYFISRNNTLNKVDYKTSTLINTKEFEQCHCSKPYHQTQSLVNYEDKLLLLTLCVPIVGKYVDIKHLQYTEIDTNLNIIKSEKILEKNKLPMPFFDFAFNNSTGIILYNFTEKMGIAVYKDRFILYKNVFINTSEKKLIEIQKAYQNNKRQKNIIFSEDFFCISLLHNNNLYTICKQNTDKNGINIIIQNTINYQKVTYFLPFSFESIKVCIINNGIAILSGIEITVIKEF